MRRAALLFATAVLVVVGCSGVSQSVSTPEVKPAWSLGAYKPSDIDAAHKKLARSDCTERDGWKCGVVLASGDGDYKGGSGWIAIIARESDVEVITNSWSNNHRSEELTTDAAKALFPPGVLVRWLDADGDNTVSNREIEVISASGERNTP